MSAKEDKLDYVACVFACIFATRELNKNSCASLKQHVKMRLLKLNYFGNLYNSNSSLMYIIQMKMLYNVQSKEERKTTGCKGVLVTLSYNYNEKYRSC